MRSLKRERYAYIIEPIKVEPKLKAAIVPGPVSGNWPLEGVSTVAGTSSATATAEESVVDAIAVELFVVSLSLDDASTFCTAATLTLFRLVFILLTVGAAGVG